MQEPFPNPAPVQLPAREVDAASPAVPRAPGGLLEPGRNCWRIEKASRVAFLIDGAEYFGAVRAALAAARHSFFILGWDIDSRMRLVPGSAADGLPEPLGPFLNALATRNPALRGHVLAWDYSMLYALEREWPPIFDLGWKTPGNLLFHADDKHPLGASHHQKVVVIDDEIAFVGGFDLAENRWDTCAHEDENPLRVDAGGKPYDPFHDVAVIVEGPCARALGELCRERWSRATGDGIPMAEERATASSQDNRWPHDVEPVLRDVNVAIARTVPALGGAAGVDELRHLHLDMIAAAQRFILAENQYFTSPLIAEAFARRLAESAGPQIALVMPSAQSGWLETSTMGVLRARLDRRLRAVDQAHRYGVYCPVRRRGDRAGPCINVHSKVLIVDDEWLTIGSANLANRSLGLDTECNLVLEAGSDKAVKQAITGLRERLLAEHTGSTREAVSKAFDEHGGLHQAIHALTRDEQRWLKPTELPLDETVDAMVPDHDVLDPERPFEPDALIVDLLPRSQERSRVSWRVVALLIFVVAMAALALAWRTTGIAGAFDVEGVFQYLAGASEEPWVLVLIPVIFVLAGFLLIPVTALIALTAAIFGGLVGGLLSFVGAMGSAAASYALGRYLGRDVVRRLAGRRLNSLSRRLAKRGLLAVLAVRLLPIAPYTLVNVVAGASHLGWRDYLLGTALGLLPGLVLTSAFVDRAIAAVRSPNLLTVATLAVLLLAIAGTVVVVQRRFRLDRDDERAPDSFAAVD